MSSPTTVFASKDGNFRPLFLFTVTFTDGSTVLRLCTDPLNTGEGGYQYSGNDYLARVGSMQIAPIQNMGQLGIDVIPNIGLTLLDPDSTIYTDYEVSPGFGGATLTMDLVLVQITPTGFNFTSDSVRRFTGICNALGGSDKTGFLNLVANHKLNLSRKSLPDFPCQPRCANSFPVNITQRASGANDRTSQFYQCGYSPDVSGGNARGNYQSGTTPFTTCNYTREDCTVRGMFKQDSSSRQTGRYSGSEWNWNTNYWTGKAYTSGQSANGYDNPNTARWGDWYPKLYGVQTVPQCLIMPSLGEPNSTRFEVVTADCQTHIILVIVNGVVVSIDGQQPNHDLLFCYRIVNSGTRNGSPCTDQSFYNGQGDPYGSLSAIEVVVPASLQQSTAAASVAVTQERVDLICPNTNNPADAPTWPTQASTSPAFCILDMLIQGGMGYADIDIATVRAADNFAQGTSVNYTKNNGSTDHHQLYRFSMYYRQRRPLNEILAAARNSCNMIIAPNSFNGGLIQFFAMGTLADQQSSAVTGSNYNTAVSSQTVLGVSTNGYLAYLFDQASIMPGTLEWTANDLSSTGNRIQFNFQDEDNQWEQDSISQIDTNAVARNANKEVDSTIQIDGICNFDQASRMANTHLFKSLYGNPQGLATGSYTFSFTSTHRVTHLRAGHICGLTWARLGLVKQLIRIESIQPSVNSEQIAIKASWHSDNWYVAALMQNPTPLYAGTPTQVPERDPLPWQPNANLFDPAQSYPLNTDGTPNATISILGNPPVNSLSPAIKAPLVPIQGNTSSTGGSFNGGQTVSVVVCGIDSNGLYSAHSRLCTVVIPSGTNTNTVVVPSLFWPTAPTAIDVFLGADGASLLHCYSGDYTTTGTPPNSITITDDTRLTPSRGLYGPPDAKFSKFKLRAKAEIHAGVWGATCTAVTGHSPIAGECQIQFLGSGWTVNQWNSYTLVRTGTVGIDVLFLQCQVVSNTTDTLTLNLDISASVSVGDVFILRAKSNHLSASTIGDDNFVNSLSAGLVTAGNGEMGNLIRIVAGTGKGQTYTIASNTSTVLTINGVFLQTLDATTRYIIEAPSWQYSVDTQPFTVTNPNPSMAPDCGDIVVANTTGQYVVQVITEDINGNWAWEHRAPIAEIYMYGSAGIARTASAGYYTITPDANGNFPIDLGNGVNQRIVLTAAASGASLPVLDAGFEDATLGAWALSGTHAVSTAFVHSGAQSLVSSPGGSFIYAYQAVGGLTPGKTYKLSAWVYIPSGSSAQGFLQAHDGTGANSVTGPAGGTVGAWQQMSIYYTANSTGNIGINVSRTTASGLLYWDDVTLTGSSILAPVFTGGTIAGGLSFTLYIDQDSTGAWLVPSFASGALGFTQDFPQQGIAGDPNTRSTYICTYHGTVWGLDSFRTGGAVS